MAKVASLQIQWYSCCLSHLSLFVVLGGGLVRICIVNCFLSWLVSVMCWYMGLWGSVRCSMNLCLICLVAEEVGHVSRELIGLCVETST